MIDMNAIRQEMDRLSGRSTAGYKSSGNSARPHRQRKTQCPCGEEVNAFTVMKDGPNNGRLFAHCKKSCMVVADGMRLSDKDTPFICYYSNPLE